VGIGYVTGANAFFHLTAREAALWGIPDGFLHRAVLRGRDLRGLRYTDTDWAASDSTYLLRITRNAEVPAELAAYLAQGVTTGVPDAYKCRTRTPWYSVPHVYQPEAFVSYMGGRSQRLVANDAGAVAPNSLHVLRMHPGAPLGAHALAAVWQTSLSRLSCEVEGHAMGGGMLKLEPREAARVLVPAPPDTATAVSLTDELDHLVRAGREDEACGLADRVVLQDGLGLSAGDCRLLRDGARELLERRHERGAGR